MSRTYYQIELSSTMLTVLLVLLAGLLVVSFALGYGAAWSMLAAGMPDGAAAVDVASGATPTPTPEEVVVQAPSPIGETPARAPAGGLSTSQMTVTPRPATPRPVPSPTATPTPKPPTPRPPVSRPTTGVETGGTFWVQVLATSRRRTAENAKTQLEELGFPADHQRVVETTVAGGNRLYKVRVGPFPDRESASRVMRRMRNSGFSDAWVVVP